MKRSEAERLIRRSDLTTGDRIVFLCLCQRADNLTAEIPARFAPSLARLASETGLHISTIARSLAHLELHRWIQRERTKGGRKRRNGIHHRTQYQVLACGTPLPCDCPKRPSGGAPKLSRGATVSEPKLSHGTNRNCRIEYGDTAGQAPVSGEGLREGGDGGEGTALCGTCEGVIDPVLTRCGYLTHPCCEPSETVPGQKVTWPGKEHAQALALVRETFGELTVLRDRTRQPGPWDHVRAAATRGP